MTPLFDFGRLVFSAAKRAIVAVTEKEEKLFERTFDPSIKMLLFRMNRRDKNRRKTGKIPRKDVGKKLVADHRRLSSGKRMPFQRAQAPVRKRLQRQCDIRKPELGCGTGNAAFFSVRDQAEKKPGFPKLGKPVENILFRHRLGVAFQRAVDVEQKRSNPEPLESARRQIGHAFGAVPGKEARHDENPFGENGNPEA